jgi:hypothetical protein
MYAFFPILNGVNNTAMEILICSDANRRSEWLNHIPPNFVYGRLSQQMKDVIRERHVLMTKKGWPDGLTIIIDTDEDKEHGLGEAARVIFTDRSKSVEDNITAIKNDPDFAERHYKSQKVLKPYADALQVLKNLCSKTNK